MAKITKYFIGIIALVFILIFILRFSEKGTYKSKGMKIVRDIENFRKTNGRLPISFKEISLSNEMGEGPYYKKESDSTYIVYFNIGFDNSLIFKSSSKKWEEKP